MTDHFLRVGNLAGHGLFGQHTLARIEQRNGHWRMQVVWRTDVHHVNIVTGDKFLPISRVGAPEGLRSGLGALLFDIGNADELHVVHLAQRGQMYLGNAAAADDGGANFIHNASPSFRFCPTQGSRFLDEKACRPMPAATARFRLSISWLWAMMTPFPKSSNSLGRPEASLPNTSEKGVCAFCP